MTNRMGRVFGASRYAGALDAYIDYIKNMDRRGARVGQGEPRPRRQPIFLEPFGIPLPSTVKLRASASEPAWTALGTAIGTRASDTLASGSTEIRLPSYKPPRVILKTAIRDNGTAKSSNRTRMKYLDYGGRSLSAPFGRSSATDTLQAAFTAIRGPLMPAGTGRDRRVYLSPERV